MGIKLSNNAVSRLASNITNSETSISLTPGSGSLFPTLSAGDWFPVTLLKATGEVEIVKATSRSTDTLTVERAQETTTALAFNAGDIVELRLTAGAIAQAKADAVAEAALPAGFGPSLLQAQRRRLDGSFALDRRSAERPTQHYLPHLVQPMAPAMAVRRSIFQTCVAAWLPVSTIWVARQQAASPLAALAL